MATKLVQLKRLLKDQAFLSLPEATQAHCLKTLLLSDRERAEKPETIAKRIHAQAPVDWDGLSPWLLGRTEVPQETRDAVALANTTLKLGRVVPASRGAQIARAGQLLKLQPLDYWTRALSGMRKVWKFAHGEPFDVFDLGRHAGHAYGLANQGEVDEEDYRPEWMKGTAWSQ